MSEKDSTIHSLRKEVEKTKKIAKEKISKTKKETEATITEKNAIIHSLKKQKEEAEATIHSLIKQKTEAEATIHSLSAELTEKDGTIHSLEKIITEKDAILKQEMGKMSSNAIPSDKLYIAYDEVKDSDLMVKLQGDLDWFDSPLSIQPGTHQASGSSILLIQMKTKEAAIAAYLGLKVKYPGLEIDKTGILCVLC